MVEEKQERRSEPVGIRATALYVPIEIDPKLLEDCVKEIRAYNEARGIPTDYSLSSRS